MEKLRAQIERSRWPRTGSCLTAIACLSCSLLSVGCNRVVNRTPDVANTSLASFKAAVKAATTDPRKPTHNRLWRADLAVLPFAEIENDYVVLHNIRDCEYRTEEDYDVRHFDRKIPLADIRTIDFIVVPFKNTPALAHTMLSFGLAGGEQVVFSVEARLEKNEGYSAVASANKEFELMWVVGTERDLIRLRTEVRNVDVYLYETVATPEMAQKAFLAAVARVNAIARTPEFYDLLTNNCTTNIVDLVNNLRPGAIPNDIRVVLPGHSDSMAYDLGLLAMPGTFEQVKSASKINLAAQLNRDSMQFSQAIRARP